MSSYIPFDESKVCLSCTRDKCVHDGKKGGKACPIIKQKREEFSMERKAKRKRGYSYPQNPNYELSIVERFRVVKDYYMGKSDDPMTRVWRFSMDSLARAYLGENYKTLYDFFAGQAKRKPAVEGT